ncbi:MAG: hypothetical protein ACO1OB_16445 [Archangium sp.]
MTHAAPMLRAFTISRFMGAVRIPLLVLFVAAPVLADQAVEVRVGKFEAKYTVYSPPSAVCEAEAQWLAEELRSVNSLLEGFLSNGTTFSEAQLPMLEQAGRQLPKLVEVHDASLTALSKCPLGKTPQFQSILEKGTALVTRAKVDVPRLPELARFTRHRVKLDTWEKQRDAQRDAARSSCSPTKSEPFFAQEDEFGLRTFEFCDGGMVAAPPGTAPWHYTPADDAGRDAKTTTMRIQQAKLFPAAQVLVAPKP